MHHLRNISPLQAILIFGSIAAMLASLALPAPYAPWPLWAILIIGVPPLLWDIAKGLLKGDFGADILAALGMVTALILQENMAATLIVLMLASGQALESFALAKASSVLEALAARMPALTHRRRGGQIEDIALSDIALEDEIVVFPHETAPVDGEVVEGHGTMDESYLTGEPYKVAKATGSAVLSGAINGEAVLVIRATKLPEDSRYATIMQVMTEAQQNRPQLRRLADRIGAIFAPLALALAIASWALTGEVTRFLAVLVVATPCPLLIAIPVVVISAISLAAKRGIIIRDPSVLELLPTCRTAIFDKTGTLTYGEPELTEILTAPDWNAQDVLQLAAALERYSKHPLAGAILAAANKEHLYLPEAVNVAEAPGKGLRGTVKGREVWVTSAKQWSEFRVQSSELSAEFPTEQGDARSGRGLGGQAPQPKNESSGLECVVAIDGQYAATLRLRDQARKEGKPFIHHLGPAHQFSKIMLVSGDRASEVAYLGELLGITEIYASQSPEQKLAIVREEAAKAPTLFMGDGINDAPALTAATVGVAFGQHSSVTSEAAGAVILDNTLSRVDELIHLSEAMRRVALQSAIGGMLASVVGMGLAAAGMITPVQGALLQEAIDVVAILAALRLAWRHDLHADV